MRGELILWPLRQILALGKNTEFVIYPTITSAEAASDILYRTSFYLRDRRVFYASSEEFELQRANYFARDFDLSPNLVRVSPRNLASKIFALRNVLLMEFQGSQRVERLLQALPNVYVLDRHRVIAEASLFYDTYNRAHDAARQPHQLDFDKLPKRESCFVFGAGPSLDRAFDYDFDRASSYRIICNSLVGDRKLLGHIKPDFIVCTDAILFGPSLFAGAFRSDLVAYLRENPECTLVTLETYFDHFSRYYQPGSNVCSIPKATTDDIVIDLRKNYVAHPYGSILNRIQLPLASTLSDRVFLLGFDGRDPAGDAEGKQAQKWGYSDDSYYARLRRTIVEAHPHQSDVDQHGYSLYNSNNAEHIISLGERAGIEYYSITDSHIPALKKRPIPAALCEKIRRRARRGA